MAAGARLVTAPATAAQLHADEVFSTHIHAAHGLAVRGLVAAVAVVVAIAAGAIAGVLARILQAVVVATLRGIATGLAHAQTAPGHATQSLRIGRIDHVVSITAAAGLVPDYLATAVAVTVLVLAGTGVVGTAMQPIGRGAVACLTLATGLAAAYLASSMSAAGHPRAGIAGGFLLAPGPQDQDHNR